MKVGVRRNRRTPLVGTDPFAGYRTSRFGGGWEWCVGVKASRHFRTVIVELLVFNVRITRAKPNKGGAA